MIHLKVPGRAGEERLGFLDLPQEIVVVVACLVLVAAFLVVAVVVTAVVLVAVVLVVVAASIGSEGSR